MRAMRFADPTTGLGTIEDADAPVPAPGQVVVEVHAAGVTPTEAVWWPTSHSKDGAPRLRAIPGHEFSGVVVTGAGDFKAGDAVFGMNDWFANGATAERIVTEPAMLVRKPQKVSHVEAASVPIGALTAMQGLLERTKLQKGERVLIHGGAGAVGVFAIQVAKSAGAHVLTTASHAQSEFLKELGADEVIDYRTERFEDKAKDIDVVFDGVGGDTLERSWGVLKEGGRLVTIAASSEETANARDKAAFLLVEMRSAQLQEIGRMLEHGQLRAVVDNVVALADAPAAYAGTLPKKLGRGKVVVTLR